MQRVILTSKNLANEHHVKITTTMDSNLPVVECDQRRMKQIFMNIISNAIKYSHEEGEVKIIIEQKSKIENQQAEKKYICIEIADDGIGMSEDEINLALSGEGAKIDKSTLHKNVSIDSHGLGMPIIKHLVELHQGQLEIKSIKNLGTRVILWFMIDPNAATSQNNQQCVMDNNSSVSRVDHYGALHKKILVVDDNPVNLMITKGILNQENYQVFTANNGKEALAVLDENPEIDLIVMDGRMSEMDGFEAAKIIRNAVGFKKFTNYNVPIIAVTGDDDEETFRKIKECGMNDYVKKGASVESLIEAVARYINRS